MRLKGVGPGEAEGRVSGEMETFLEGSEARKTDAGAVGNNTGDLQPERKEERNLLEELPDWPLVQMALLPQDPRLPSADVTHEVCGGMGIPESCAVSAQPVQVCVAAPGTRTSGCLDCGGDWEKEPWVGNQGSGLRDPRTPTALPQDSVFLSV